MYLASVSSFGFNPSRKGKGEYTGGEEGKEMDVPVVVVEEWPLLNISLSFCPVLRLSTFAAVPVPVPYAELVSRGACVDPAEDRGAGWLTLLFCAIL